MDKYVTSTSRLRNPSAQSDTPRSRNPSGLAESASDAGDIQLPEFSSLELMPGTSRAEDMDIADTEAEQAEGGHGSRGETDLYRDWDILKPFFKCFESFESFIQLERPQAGYKSTRKKMQTLSHRTNIVNYVIINGSP